mmetsp:Transcript_9035/g.25223  ORF Transcript_9035/g.25223 Transcript_9035/m.25223 type:complete len:260 (-) Transcript_9035:62-841(-)
MDQAPIADEARSCRSCERNYAVGAPPDQLVGVRLRSYDVGTSLVGVRARQDIRATVLQREVRVHVDDVRVQRVRRMRHRQSAAVLVQGLQARALLNQDAVHRANQQVLAEDAGHELLDERATPGLKSSDLAKDAALGRQVGDQLPRARPRYAVGIVAAHLRHPGSPLRLRLVQQALRGRCQLLGAQGVRHEAVAPAHEVALQNLQIRGRLGEVGEVRARGDLVQVVLDHGAPLDGRVSVCFGHAEIPGEWNLQAVGRHS